MEQKRFADAEAMLRGRMVRLIDTAGLEESAPETLAGRMRASSETAVGQAHTLTVCRLALEAQARALAYEGR